MSYYYVVQVLESPRDRYHDKKPVFVGARYKYATMPSTRIETFNTIGVAM